MNKPELVELLLNAKDAYYNSSEPLMPDEEYDRLEDELRQIDPDNSFFSLVGSAQSSLISLSDISAKKITHKIPMLSMNKAKNTDDLEKWIDKIDGAELEYCIQPKIDGLSATCYYSRGLLEYVATRGDGSTGQDISHISEYVDDIPSSIPGNITCEVRGELYLPKNTHFDTEGRPLRNNCVGLVNRKENRDDLKYVRFISYQIAGTENISFKSESDKIEFLAKSGFHTVPFSVLNGIDNISVFYKSYLDDKREKWLFETDGLIVTVNDSSAHDEIDSRRVVDHHHHYSIAIKPPPDVRSSELTDIEWNISRQGNLIPVAIFKPVVIGGAKLQRASLHNYQFVRELGLHRNDILEIERANDVIPYVRGNMTRHSEIDEFLVPDTCPSCSATLTERGVHLSCPNENCDEQIIQRIIFWVKESSMDQIAGRTIRFLFEKIIIRSIRDLYLVKKEDLEGLEGFGDKKIRIFFDAVGNKDFTAGELISKMGIPLVQKKALRKLGIFTIRQFLDFDDDTYAIGRNIIEWKTEPANMTLLNELMEVLDISDEKSGAGSKGIVCMTGAGPRGRKELAMEIEAKGYTFSDSITKETEILLAADPGSTSSKLQKARKLGIRILSYDDFFNE